jgi:hypothetical protein
MTTTPIIDTTKLSTRDRHAYENGMALVSKKLAAARLAQIALKTFHFDIAYCAYRDLGCCGAWDANFWSDTQVIKPRGLPRIVRDGSFNKKATLCQRTDCAQNVWKA